MAGEHLVLSRKWFPKWFVEEAVYRMDSADFTNEETFVAALNKVEAQVTLDYLVLMAQLNTN